MSTPADFSYKEIAPLIRVYKNLLPCHQGLVATLDEMVEIDSDDYFYGKWEKWFIFGKYSHLRFNLKEVMPKNDPNFAAQFHLYRQVHESTRMAIAHYAADYKIPNLPAAYITDVSLAYYEDGLDISVDKTKIAMVPHSDYVIPEEGWPGEKFFITATTYLNDNYEGGEIYFIFDDKKVVYKPQAGDIVVFPSGSPIWPGKSTYFHGVNTPLNNRKYLLRCYLKYTTGASQEYVDGVKEYGEEEWKKMCKEKHQKKPTPGGQFQ